MSKNPQYALRLTQRDFNLFSYLFFLKGAARHQINRDIFANVTKGVLHDRLTKLTKHGFLEIGLFDYGMSRTCYFATPKALESLSLVGVKTERRELKSACQKHDLFLVDVRQKFLSAKGCVQYLTENQLQSETFNDKGFNYQCFRELNSDAFLRVKIGSGEFSGAVEYEQSNKGRARYEPLFHSYYSTENVVFVLYICHSVAFQNTLMKIEKSVRGKKDSKFFFTTQQCFRDSQTVISFINSESEKIEIPLEEKLSQESSRVST